jgi:hypothetical protein
MCLVLLGIQALPVLSGHIILNRFGVRVSPDDFIDLTGFARRCEFCHSRGNSHAQEGQCGASG